MFYKPVADTLFEVGEIHDFGCGTVIKNFKHAVFGAEETAGAAIVLWISLTVAVIKYVCSNTFYFVPILGHSLLSGWSWVVPVRHEVRLSCDPHATERSVLLV